MLFTKFSSNLFDNRFHSFLNSPFNPLVVLIFFFDILIFRSCQTFSIGFWSGDIDGQGSTTTPKSSFHFLQIFERCLGSLSSCKIHSILPSPKSLQAEGRRPFS